MVLSHGLQLLEAGQRRLHEPRVLLLLLEGRDQLGGLVERLAKRIAEGRSLPRWA